MDWDLLNQARTDPQALETLFTRHRDRVYRIAWGMLSNPSAADDVVQEVFMRIVKNKRFHWPGSQFTTWLHTVTLNTARQYLRKHKREVPTAPEDLRLLNNTASDHVDQTAKLEEISRLLGELTGRQREVFILRALEGYSTAETAAICKCGQASVKTHLHRAMNLLREKLNHD